MGELHRNRTYHQFLQALLKDPELPHKVNDIVVEFGNALYQPTIDRYIAGGTVKNSDLRKVWRNTTQFMPWDVPEYEQFFRGVRNVNRHLPSQQKLHVHLGDPPIDWNRVHTPGDFEQYAKRDTFYFQVVDNLLAHHRKALLIYGAMHFLKRDIRGPQSGPSKEPLPELARRYGEKLVSVWPVTGPSNLLHPHLYPDLISVRNTSLGKLSSRELLPPSLVFLRKVNGQVETYSPDPSVMPKLGEVIDLLLFVSPTQAITNPSKAVFQDRGYMAELRKRAPILQAVFGMDFLEQLKQEELASK
jgi:hypothetical protein